MKAKKVSTHNMRKILPLYFKHKGLLFVTMIFIFSSGVFGILVPIFSANMLASIADGKFELAIKFTLILTGLNVLKMISNALDEFFYIKLNYKMCYELTNIVINSINRTKMSRIDSVGLGSISERISNDVGTLNNVCLDLINIIFDILTNVVFLIYVAYINVYLFLILLVYVLVLYIVCTIRSRIWIRGSKLSRKAKDGARSAYLEQILGIRDVKLLNIKNQVTEFSNKKYESALALDIKVNNKRNLIRRIQAIITMAFNLAFFLIGINLVNKNLLLISGLLIIETYYSRVSWLVSYISSFKERKAEGEIAATRIFEIIENYEKEEFGTEELNNFSGKIELKDVSFSYNSEQTVLDGLNISFEPGQITAIVGKSGSGKTTILSLISKLYETSSGEILFDGKEIKTLTEQSIRGNVGEVSQSPYIFNASVRQNLLFVKPDASEEELIGALKDAQIYEDIEKMPNGMDTEIGENGVKLSGGQKQRIAIARLLLLKTKVIVFDEATSALDNNRQNKIVELLETIKRDRTIIIVAHRLSTIVGSDKIYMLDDGKVLGEGTHRSLMKSCKEYKELYKLEEENAKVEESDKGE